MKPELKDMLDKICDLFNAIDEKTGIMQKAEVKGQLCNVLKFELVSFLACLSACDGRMSKVEAQLIRDYFGLEMYPIHVKNFVYEHNVGTDEYYEKVPECLKLAVKVDKIMLNEEQKGKGISELVVELFKVFGKEMVVADEKVKAEEQIAWSKYITMMVRFVDRGTGTSQEKGNEIRRPGSPIEVNYEMSLNKIGRIYTVYVGKI